MKRTIISCMAVVLGLTSFAQTEIANAVVLDLAEDTTQVTSIADIIAVQEKVTSNNSTVQHFKKVWGRNTYFNISYANATLTPKQDIPLGYKPEGNTKGLVPEFKSDWGASIQFGHNYHLHKKPIANTLQFNIDYTYIDLNINHFTAEKGKKLYNSAETWEEKGEYNSLDKYYYIPWCLEKYEANYSMALGPSLTIAPFSFVKVPQLQYVKLNVYYHIGYQISLLWMMNDKEKDANPNQSTTSSGSDFEKVKGALKMNWGHGMTSSFGFNVTWKSIGVGYEIRSGKLEYQSMQTDTFGKKKYKFDASVSRVYLQIRY